MSNPNHIYNRRLNGTIDFITRILDNEEEFKKLKERWDKEADES